MSVTQSRVAIDLCLHEHLATEANALEPTLGRGTSSLIDPTGRPPGRGGTAFPTGPEKPSTPCRSNREPPESPTPRNTRRLTSRPAAAAAFGSPPSTPHGSSDRPRSRASQCPTRSNLLVGPPEHQIGSRASDQACGLGQHTVVSNMGRNDLPLLILPLHSAFPVATSHRRSSASISSRWSTIRTDASFCTLQVPIQVS